MYLRFNTFLFSFCSFIYCVNNISGGKDAASPRYVFTTLNPMTRMIFNAHDDSLLNFLNEDGMVIEPVSFRKKREKSRRKFKGKIQRENSKGKFKGKILKKKSKGGDLKKCARGD